MSPTTTPTFLLLLTYTLLALHPRTASAQYNGWEDINGGVHLTAQQASKGGPITLTCSMHRKDSTCRAGIQGNYMNIQKTATDSPGDNSFQDIATIRAGNKITANTGGMATVTGGFDVNARTHIEYTWSSSGQAAVGRYRCAAIMTCCAIITCTTGSDYSTDTVVVSQSGITTQPTKI